MRATESTIEGCMLLDEQDGEDCVACTDDPSKWCQICVEVEVEALRKGFRGLRTGE